MKNTFIFLIFICLLSSCRPAEPPSPYGAVPSERQLAWHEMEYYAFVHFNMNTFTGKEWGFGDESPALFNPTELDCRQWARTAKEAGMKGIILTAKHHDGFCLWPSQYTEHSVKNSPWRDGKGDVVAELAEACKEYDLKMGIYLSPWDRNHADYGKPEYIKYFRNQLRELLTNYGDIFEVWFDGANGGSGYYGGANETRNVDRQTYYDWENTFQLVRELQPNAVIFSDGGPDVRWVGNEQGFADPTNWCTLDRDSFYPGSPRYQELQSGHKGGTHWVPAEVDVSIRPGWYYHPEEDKAVKSADHLELIYYNSVGRNASLLLNLPVDQRGLVHENDVKALMGLRERLDATLEEDLARGGKVKASNTRSRRDLCAPSNLTDGDNATYWATEDHFHTAFFEIDLGEEKTFNVVELREHIPLGQRVEEFSLEAYHHGDWKEIARGTTIGAKYWVRTPRTTASRIRVNILNSLGGPVLSGISVYHRPHDNYLIESRNEFDERMAWWRDAKFGMFIHWGAYAVPAGMYKGQEISGIGEWIMNSARIPVREYEEFVLQFNPVQFNADEWVAIAKNAGMQYIVITSKHHDGFCLWDSKVTKYDAVDAAPFGRDILKELHEACEREGIKLCFYHSIMDWYHPDAQGKDFGNVKAGGPDFVHYRENYLKPQLRELVENYDPHVLWFDGEWIDEWTEPQGKDLYNFVRSLKPDIIINNRVGKGRQGMQGMNKGAEFVGDFGTPEQEILEHGSGDVDWESCMTMNDTWGYKVNDHNWKSAQTLIHNLVDIAAKGGNYLLNVGPTAEGLIPGPSVERLREMGDWMAVNGEAVYGARMWRQYREGEAIRYTYNPAEDAVYAICLEWPGEELRLKYIRPETNGDIELLGYERFLDWSFDEEDGLIIRLPGELQDESRRPCRYAWVLKIKGTFPKVVDSPKFGVSKNKNIEREIFSGAIEVEMKSATKGADIYYTLDGSAPTERATRYSGPIQIESTAEVRAVAVKPGMVGSPSAKARFIKSTYNSIELAHPHSERYTGGGRLALLDGQYGSTNFLDGRWQGYEGHDLEAVIDLGQSRPVKRVKVNFLQDLNVWIFPPTSVSFAVSEDGKTFRTPVSKQIETPKEQAGPVIHAIDQPLAGAQGRYVKVSARNVGVCPSWHGGAGGKAWLFVDEVKVIND
jgi:alpha-L-fucosidase